MKPVCVPCQRFFRAKRVGFYFIEGMPTSTDAKPGQTGSDKWRPYKLWVGDLWECVGCGSTIVTGVGLRPIGEHYEADFALRAKQLGAAQLQVNDC